jgi:hypothetical protein
MVRLFLPLLVSVKEIKTLEYHNYIRLSKFEEDAIIRKYTQIYTKLKKI